jgi:hypothetical protein
MLSPVTTPYDDDRSRYSRAALARLVLSYRASGLSDAAGNLAVTRYDAYTGAGGRVSEAASLVAGADRLLAGAVIFERERGSSWEEIGHYLGVSAAAAEERFAPAIEAWEAAFEVPYRLDETGRKRVPQLPQAAFDPERTGRQLDLWAYVRLGFVDKHAVTGGLDQRPDDDPGRSDIDGRIRRRHLTTFLKLLAFYVHSEPYAGVWDGEETYTMEGISESLDIRMTPGAGTDQMSVLVAGAHSAALRLRVSTLLDAFAD